MVDDTYEGEQGTSDVPAVKSEEKEVPKGRAELVSQWQSRVKKAKEYWSKDFKRMREDMQLAYAGADKSWIDNDNFVVPIIGRHINQTVATLYAKDPQVVVEPKRRIENVLWDGRKDTLDAALMSLQQALTPQMDAMGAPLPPVEPDPMALQLVQEVQAIQQHRLMLKKVCKTLEILLEYYFGEQEPLFKTQLKQLVRRVKTCGVGYVYLGFQRLLEKRPEISARLEDVTGQLATLERLMTEKRSGRMEEDSAQAEQLRLLAKDLSSQMEVIAREGPVFDFPMATSIIHDTKMVQLNGMIGSTWFAREFWMTKDEVLETYKVDVGTEFTSYRKIENSTNGAEEWTSDKANEKTEDCSLCVWEIWSKGDGQTFTVVDGYCDFVKEPAAPPVRLERFWPIFTLTFNDVEHETKRFPLSDARMLRHTQLEYNRSRQIRRLHRISNTPKYIIMAGRLSESDKKKLSSADPFSVIEVNGIMEGQDVGGLLQQLKTAPLDPALYETNTEMEDVYRTVGIQEAVMGGTSNATATEVSVGEETRTTASDANVNDLDTLLSQVVRATAQSCLLSLDESTVKKLVGAGAVWPQLSREEIVSEIWVDIKAGSSGKPNAAAELAKIERAAPFLIQFDNVSMKPLAEKYASLLDLDPEELIIDGLPSQTALNAMASKLTSGGLGAPAGTPSSVDQTAQGAQGGNNAPAAPAQEPGAQPAYPVPGAPQ